MDASTPSRARYRRILRFAARHLAVTWWFEIAMPRIGLARLAARSRSRRMTRFARSFHDFAIELGGLMIKVGQFMSSRLDVLPPEITKELEGLQDEVPAVPGPDIRAEAEGELGMPLARAFADVEDAPIAAASLGQAHRATLTDADAAIAGFREAVVKVQRPGIANVVATDLAALRRVGGWLSRFRLVSDRADMPALVEEFARTSDEEIDYLHEAQSAERFAELFAADDGVGAPEVVWERTARRVLTLQDVTAIKITDHAALQAVGIAPADVAHRFATTMFAQLFTHGWFHADPHPGNVFVTPLGGTDAEGRPRWRLTFIDFGMMGAVPPTTRRGLRRMLIAAASRDGKGLVDGIRDIGVLLPSADTAELERAMTQAFARFGGMGFAELREVDPREFRAFAIEFQELLRTLPFQLPEDMLLVIRAMSLTSGVCSSLDPAFNIWDAVEPFASRLLQEERGNVVQDVARQTIDAARVAAGLPQRIDAAVTRIEEGRLQVATPRLERRLERVDRGQGRIVSAVLFAGLLVGGAVLQGDGVGFGTVLMVVAIAPFAHAVLGSLLDRWR
ncbi:ABC1 kinase family protein [Agrococcus sp. SGAir0287]|uniref:ABC1 kinase family protein n=1 Tax=Agrococcus sp. SGAir0287 TaxID=2070347 RepID=UPI0010CCCD6A|nr:AarF/UbiB family protein [Agrococcus sp. SGAir0287]QCR19124.1 ABC transporter [Agrococcus sp. SGAir0287]